MGLKERRISQQPCPKRQGSWTYLVPTSLTRHIQNKQDCPCDDRTTGTVKSTIVDEIGFQDVGGCINGPRLTKTSEPRRGAASTQVVEFLMGHGLEWGERDISS